MSLPQQGTAPLNVGFLTVQQEPSGGYLGGYLVTNGWGRPLEFRLSTAVQPNRVQQILYAGTLEPYICADLIGKTLVEKTSAQPGLIVTDRESVLDLRLRLSVPVIWLASGEVRATIGTLLRPEAPGRVTLYGHGRFPDDAEAVQMILKRVEGSIDLAEPFTRVREAMSEARKMGVTNRGQAA
jgi:hypothetical protein